MIVALYLAAIVAANLSAAAFGPAITVVNAFLFIGLNLTARDALHDRWVEGLRWKMGALILAGAVLSYVLNASAGRIAIASFIAFALSEGVDAVVYHRLRHIPWIKRVTGSNTVSALVDSVVFPTIAFGVFMPAIIAGQWLAKVFGGAVWAWVMRPKRALAVLLLALAPQAVSAQFVSLGAGIFTTRDFTEPVVEAVAGTSIGWLAPNVIVSWSPNRGLDEPIIIPQVGMDVWVPFPWIIGFDVGPTLTPWTDYRDPDWGGSLRVFYIGPEKWSVFAIIGSSFEDPQMRLVLKVNRTLWQR